jgi:preprotein translocase subunit SecE
MRRHQKKEEDRARKRRQQVPTKRKKERTGIRQYLREVRQELKKVAWPTREQTATYTIVVVVVTLFVTGFVLVADIVFKRGVLAILGA